jgi:hypothetical protein
MNVELQLNNLNSVYTNTPKANRHELPEDAKIMSISTLSIKSVEERLVYDSGNYLMHMKSEFQKRYLDTFFRVDKKLELDAVESCLKTLQGLKSALLKLQVFFEGSSVQILFSKKNKECLVKYVNFSGFPRPLEKGHLDGLDELIRVLSSIVEENQPKK